jgi:hypothetical protein
MEVNWGPRGLENLQCFFFSLLRPTIVDPTDGTDWGCLCTYMNAVELMLTQWVANSNQMGATARGTAALLTLPVPERAHTPRRTSEPCKLATWQAF